MKGITISHDTYISFSFHMLNVRWVKGTQLQHICKFLNPPIILSDKVNEKFQLLINLTLLTSGEEDSDLHSCILEMKL